MGLYAKNKPRELLQAGMHHAICYSVIHLGTQRETYKGETSDVDEVKLTFEFPNIRGKFERDGVEVDLPRVKSTFGTRISLHEKSNLGKMLTSWRGKQFTPAERKTFNILSMAGQNCEIQIIHETKDEITRDKIGVVHPRWQQFPRFILRVQSHARSP